MSKNDAVTERGGKGGNETTGAADADVGAETVDLGIGISVDIDVEDIDEDADHVELAFDEDDYHDSADESVRDRTDDGKRGDRDGRGRGRELETGERERLENAGVDPDAVREKEYSYRLLLNAGLDEATADTLRRRFSLPWSFEGDGDLERRSSEVRGLGAAEREWIAVSGDEDWQSFEYEHSPIAAVERDSPSERPYPKPTPATAVTGVGPDDAAQLAEAGVRSAERLATVSAFTVATALDLDVLHVRSWRHNARELLDN
ncbi:hypothetical protein Htur_1167 [Haloterrigena turkmenica DSM 5511]|uniref:Uncharacterized protein n=1 Tax=Haloterrigena turkmenica (strain ATCC 51198 / DSM 5511 / JCM 9101 / NCIMB 13204 / VKM B-1734 / 4k) TaxID=543526 RepID=D2RZD5_HALTV|nr:hypothetical protein [Haloterrigena turkmenica]ADB60059.1 hypothetical protein Htur_1167 [Haloterrigena turkmenica DSM 5511]